MKYTRRDMALVATSLAAASASAKPLEEEVLPSKCYPFTSLPAKTSAKGMEVRQVFDGLTHQGFPINMHISTLPPGQSPHPAHTHVHEEMMMIETGTLELTISGQTTRIGPGSVAYVHSNDLHMLQNVGEIPATYFVLAIGQQNQKG